MAIPVNVQITVTKIITAPGRGILASGYVESGMVHVGDLLQVHNHHPGATARVGQISLGNKMAKEARAGDEAMLLLEKIEEKEIRSGDLLLPGQQKLPKRIQPILHFRQLTGKIGTLAVVGIFIVIPLIIMQPLVEIIISTGVNNRQLPFLAFFLIWFGIAGFAMYKQIKVFVGGLVGHSQLLHNQAQITAKRLRRRMVEHEGKYDTTYTFHFQIEFTPTLATDNTSTLHLEADVSGKVYGNLQGGKTVNMNYAIDNPRIFTIEGE